MPTERRLAAIMFTDIVGYTALMAESEEKGLRARGQHRALVRPLVEQYHGESIEARGDESLSVFPTALDAVNCALAIQEQLEDDPQKPRLHIGIHQSDIELRQGEVIGDGVNISARICARSDGSGPYISDEVQHAVQNQTNLSFESLGAQEFKNVPRPVPVYRVAGAAQPPRPLSVLHRLGIRRPGRWLAAAGVLLVLTGLGVGSHYWPGEITPIRSIAVLPLEKLSGDAEQEYFADGTTEELIGELAKLDSLRVISRTSVVRYKGQRTPLSEIAKDLNVDAVLEGTVTRAGERVRITTQLIDARTDDHVWSERYERDLRDVLALQSEIARAVAAQIQLELTPQENARLAATRLVDPEAHDAYLRGLQHVSIASMREGLKAVDLFKQAVETDPNYADAHAALAYTYTRLSLAGSPVAEVMEKARSAALRALALDDDSALAHAALSQVLFRYDWDWDAGRRELERAVELSPGDPLVLDRYSNYLAAVERHDEAIAVSRRAVDAAPFDPRIRAEYAFRFYYARRSHRAREELLRVIDSAPHAPEPYVFLYIVDLELGLAEESGWAIRKFRDAAGLPQPVWEEEVFASFREEQGLDDRLRVWLPVALKHRDQIPPVVLVASLARVGENDLVFETLEQMYVMRHPTLVLLRAAPAYDPLRSDPRFQDLLRRIGFPEN